MEREFIYLGYARKDIYNILAEEEAMQELVQEWQKPLFMTRMVSRPAVTIAEREDINDIQIKECLEDEIDFTRRLGGGSVIWLDGKMLAYFLAIPKGWAVPGRLSDEFAFHREISRKIALALKNLGAKQVYVGEKFSIAFGPGPEYVVSGNAAAIKAKYLFYHGVLVLDDLSLEAIKKYIVLRNNERVDEAKLLARLPSLRRTIKRRVSVRQVSIALAESIANGRFRPAVKDELTRLRKKSRSFVEKYRNPHWISNPEVIIEKNLGFCLIALSETWREDRFYPV